MILTILLFFEMLGNWSLGDYFKKEMIAYSYEFLTKELGIDPSKLSVTVFEGDSEVERDNEAASAWESNGIPKERIFFMSREDNWWGPAGSTGPCGPDSEMFIDTGRPKCSDDCKPGCFCGKYFEIWNDVFMQYNKTADGKFEKLSRPCIDTGMGVERTVAILSGKKSVYEIDTFTTIIKKINELSGKTYGEDEKTDISIRIIAGSCKNKRVYPWGSKRNCSIQYRSGLYFATSCKASSKACKKIGIENVCFLNEIANVVIELYKEPYPELEQNKDFVFKNLEEEGNKFLETLVKGEKEFEKLLPNLLKVNSKTIPGRIAFKLYDTYGFPLELTVELARENGLIVDENGFNEAFKKHQETSRTATAGVFKGGLMDHSEKNTALHTATHLLHAVLAKVLKTSVKQLGSN